MIVDVEIKILKERICVFFFHLSFYAVYLNFPYIFICMEISNIHDVITVRQTRKEILKKGVIKETFQVMFDISNIIKFEGKQKYMNSSFHI